ncbi:MAG: hypothetical protein LC808_08990 [Actinobacteria bacterium]|nr:hypothetical protein [Actinomycetota bacterium]
MLLLAAVTLAFLPQQPAQAHNFYAENEVFVYMSGSFCVKARGTQNHASHRIETSVWRSSCYSAGPARAPGQMTHRAEWYAGGRYCAYLSPRSNTQTGWY